MSDDKRLERIENKIDTATVHLSSIDVTLAKQHVSLVDHIARTELLEKDLAPIKKHVYMIQGAMALITLLGILAGIYEAFKK